MDALLIFLCIILTHCLIRNVLAQGIIPVKNFHHEEHEVHEDEKNIVKGIQLISH